MSSEKNSPGSDLHLSEAPTAELIRQIEDGMLDIAILTIPVEGNNLVMRELFREPIHLAVPDFHILASAEKVMLRRVSAERLLILNKDGQCLRDETLTICDRARARFAAQFEADQFASIFELIRAGFGVSLVPEMARRGAAGCRLIPIGTKGDAAGRVRASGTPLCLTRYEVFYGMVAGSVPGCWSKIGERAARSLFRSLSASRPPLNPGPDFWLQRPSQARRQVGPSRPERFGSACTF